MILLTHIIIALAGLAITTYAYLRPSTTHLRLAYGTVGLTFATGFLLVAVEPATMLQACTSGLVYLGIASLGIMATRVKLARMYADSVRVHHIE